jgi:hypothetical protein
MDAKSKPVFDGLFSPQSKTYLTITAVCCLLLVGGCSNSVSSASNKNELTLAISELYYRELADLQLLPFTMKNKLEGFNVNDSNTHRLIDQTIGAIDLWSENRPHVFFNIESLQEEDRKEIAQKEVVLKVEEVYSHMLQVMGDIKTQVLDPASEALQKNGTLTAEKKQELLKVVEYSKKLYEATAKFHSLHNQKDYLYDSSVFGKDLINSLDKVLLLLQEMEESVLK